jgi:hypothetical protein
MDDHRFEYELRQALLRRAGGGVPSSLASRVHAIPTTMGQAAPHQIRRRALNGFGVVATLVAAIVVTAALVALRPSARLAPAGAAPTVAPTSTTTAATPTPVAATPAAATPAPVKPSTEPSAAATAPFDAAIQALVDDGTLDPHQAAAVRQQIDAGQIDLGALVSSGVLTATQMEAVQTRLRAVKESQAGGQASQPPVPSSPTSKEPPMTGASSATGTGPFDAAVQALVDDGTINQRQAGILRQQIDAGSVDLEGLVQSGVLTSMQMQVVESRLRGVKESIAAGQASHPPKALSTLKETLPKPSATK